MIEQLASTNVDSIINAKLLTLQEGGSIQQPWFFDSLFERLQAVPPYAYALSCHDDEWITHGVAVGEHGVRQIMLGYANEQPHLSDVFKQAGEQNPDLLVEWEGFQLTGSPLFVASRREKTVYKSRLQNRDRVIVCKYEGVSSLGALDGVLTRVSDMRQRSSTAYDVDLHELKFEYGTWHWSTRLYMHDVSSSQIMNAGRYLYVMDEHP